MSVVQSIVFIDLIYFLPVREPHEHPAERERHTRGGGGGAAEARGERRDHEREDRGGALARELALQITQQEEEEIPNAVLPQEE